MPAPPFIPRTSKRTQRVLDTVLLCLLAGIFIGMLVSNKGHLDSGAWHWKETLRAFFHINPDTGFTPGPLGTGLIVTCQITFWTLIFGGAGGLVLGLARTSHVRFLQITGSICITFLRNLPPLVLIFIIHFFLTGPLTAAVDWQMLYKLPGAQYLFPAPNRIPVFISATVVLSLYESAYIAEIVRAGIRSIPQGQWEAAESLGLIWYHKMRYVIVPQALQLMIPPLTGQLVSLIKDSAIVSIISVQELTFQTTEFITSSQMAGEVWTATTVCYLSLCLIVSYSGKFLEKRLRH